jgi:hypothetical protein
MKRLIASVTYSSFRFRRTLWCMWCGCRRQIWCGWRSDRPMRQIDDGSSQPMLHRSSFRDSFLNDGQRGVKGRVNHLGASSLVTAVMPGNDVGWE